MIRPTLPVYAVTATGEPREIGTMSWDNGEPADGTRVRVAGIARDVHADALFRHTFPPMPTEGSVGTVTGQSSPSRVVVAWDDGTPSAAWRRGDLEPVAPPASAAELARAGSA